MRSRATTNAIIAEVLAYQIRAAAGTGLLEFAVRAERPLTSARADSNPLAYLCQQAHAQGIEVHAWLVTYRISTVWPPSGTHM